MKANAFLTSLFEKLGIDATDPVAKQLTSNPALVSVELPDTFTSKFEQDFYTEETALHQPSIRRKIMAESLNAVDKKIKDAITKYEISDEIAEEILAGGNSYDRLEKLNEKLVSAQQEKIRTTGKDRDALTDSIAKLNKDILNEKALLQAEKAGRKQDNLNNKLNTVLSSEKYAGEFDADYARFKLEKRAQEKGYKLDLDERGNLKVLSAEDGNEFFDNHAKVTDANTFLKKQLLEMKLLAVNDNNKVPGNNVNREIPGRTTLAQPIINNKPVGDLTAFLNRANEMAQTQPGFEQE